MCAGNLTSDNANDMKPRMKKGKSRRMRPSKHDGKKVQYQGDILASFTYYTKEVLFTIGELMEKFQHSNLYKILFYTTQPAHLIIALSVLLVSYLLYPSEKKSALESPIWSLLYLASFCIHFGAQIWMTFVSGLALYFALPRHTFGNIQRVLFPKYFLLNSVLSFITLVIFIMGHNSEITKPHIALQVGAMFLCFLVELIIRLYLTPPLLQMMVIKNAIEKEAGVGDEIGKLAPGDLMNCPHYVKIHKIFRKIHMSIAIGNIVAMSCTMFHLYHLSQKLCVL